MARQGEVKAIDTGRGEAWFVKYHQADWVLRRYLRGGMVARFNRSYYLGWSQHQSRAWKEWDLLYQLRQRGLPVPEPVAACICWNHSRLLGLYQAQLLVKRIAGAQTLAERLVQESLSKDAWRAVGACIRRFHEMQVFHADLNANNILFDQQGSIYLIDFDRGEYRDGQAWKPQNLARLLRSLKKLKARDSGLHFAENNWQDLLSGYQENAAAQEVSK